MRIDVKLLSISILEKIKNYREQKIDKFFSAILYTDCPILRIHLLSSLKKLKPLTDKEKKKLLKMFLKLIANSSEVFPTKINILDVSVALIPEYTARQVRKFRNQ